VRPKDSVLACTLMTPSDSLTASYFVVWTDPLLVACNKGHSCAMDDWPLVGPLYIA